MEIKLTPFIVFLLLLVSLIFSIVIRNKIGPLLNIQWNVEGYTDRSILAAKIQQLNYNGPPSTASSAGTGVVPSYNITPLYDASGVLVANPISGVLYYNANKQLVNFPIQPPVYDANGSVVVAPVTGKYYYDASGVLLRNPQTDKVFDEMGNVLVSPPTVGFMLDSNGNPLDLPAYDGNGQPISDFSKYTGTVYDSYHNKIQFPYFDANGNYTVSPIMNAEIFKKYMSYLKGQNNTPSSTKCSDISGCSKSVDYANTSLDDYISDYYQHFWNQNRQMYSDDYILKTEIVPPNCPSYPVGSYGGWERKEPAKCPRAPSPPIQNVINGHMSNAGENAHLQNMGLGVSNTVERAENAVQRVGNEVKNDFNAAANKGSALLQINPTQINTSRTTTNSKGLSGNYNGDNSLTNTGYLSTTNQFSGTEPANVATFNNNYNATPTKGESNFLPLTADFSSFAR
jgi:hypothetical protein